MWPELWMRRLVTSPVTQTRPTSFSSSRFTCDVNSLTVSTRRVVSAGNNSPKSHWDLDCLPTRTKSLKLEIVHYATQDAISCQVGVSKPEFTYDETFRFSC